MSWEENFLRDLAILTLGELRDKYEGKIPEQTTLLSLIKIAKESGLILSLVSKHWYGDYRDKSPILLMRKESGNYEVFYSERGGKHIIKEYADVESALRDYLSRILNELMFSAVDRCGFDE